VHFEADLVEQNRDGTWRPFKAKDVQLQFIMLDPYYTVPLSQQGETPVYAVDFHVPDRLGIFKFQVAYSRYGYTYINEETKVSVIQYQHDEFPRFIPKAYPYYFSVFSTMAAFFLFIMVFLYSKWDGPAKKSQQSER